MKLDNSQYRLRKAIGILGIALPILLLLNHDDLLSSMSHYYYTSAGVFFIGILVAFGLILFTYQGYPRAEKEMLSDEAITTLAAICIFITVLIPTSSEGALGQIHFEKNLHYLFGHNSGIKGPIHLISAGLFLVLLGYMCHAKFTMSENISPARRKFYKTCGITIWSSIGILILIFAIEALFKLDFNCYLPAYTFWFEMIAVWAFGIAWLIKGKFDRDIRSILLKTDKAK